MMKVAIIKYGMGNTASVEKSIRKLGHICVITNDHAEIQSSDFIILPGVGSFSTAMENLNKFDLIDLLTYEVTIRKKPFLGICLGMQLVATYGTEPNRVKGLDWIKGEVVKIQGGDGLKIPHLGWNNVVVDRNNTFYEEFNELDYYFIHSYHFVAEDPEVVVLWVKYNDLIIAGLQKDNIHALQFHPEKSQEAGLSLLKKIFSLYA